LRSRDSSPSHGFASPSFAGGSQSCRDHSLPLNDVPKSRRLSEGGKPIDARRRLRFLPKPSCCPRFPSNPACLPGSLALSFAFKPCPSILSSSSLVSAVTLSDLGAHIHVLLSSFVTLSILIGTYHNPSRTNLYKPVPTCSIIVTATSAPERRNTFRCEPRFISCTSFRTSALQVSGLSRYVCNSSQLDRCVGEPLPILLVGRHIADPSHCTYSLGV